MKLEDKGWNKLVIDHQGCRDFSELNFNHPAQDLLRHYKAKGVPVKSHTKCGQKECWTMPSKGELTNHVMSMWTSWKKNSRT